jgi:hypothetical protein
LLSGLAAASGLAVAAGAARVSVSAMCLLSFIPMVARMEA